jgi:Na+/melibiose symporter-like transporter
LFDKYGPRQLVITGIFITAAGTFMLSFVGTETSLLYITVVYTFRMCGMNLVNMPLATWGINALPNSLIAHGNAVAGTARMVSSSLGTAILITVMLMVQNAHTELSRAAALARGVDVVFAIAAVTMAIALVVAFAKVRNDEIS